VIALVLYDRRASEVLHRGQVEEREIVVSMQMHSALVYCVVSVVYSAYWYNALDIAAGEDLEGVRDA